MWKRSQIPFVCVVLEQKTDFEPTEIMTDTGAYTDVIFGIFWLLGFQFSPRIAYIGGPENPRNTSNSAARFWRVDPKADYSALDKLASHKANTSIIAQHWDDLLRLAGSLKLGLVQVERDPHAPGPMVLRQDTDADLPRLPPNGQGEVDRSAESARNGRLLIEPVRGSETDTPI